MIPFIKWAGGKRWLTDRIVSQVPTSYNRYLEPFLGGAAVFFRLQPKAAVLSDANAELISTYEVVRANPKGVESELRKFQLLHSKTFYYSVRASSPTDPLDQAVRFLYLNRTCWNGLYRVNRNGLFNVPKGTKNAVVLETDDFSAWATALHSAEIVACDFATTLARAKKGDLVYVDPPYTVKHNNNGFLKYNQNIFSWDDQVRLRNECVRARKRGATVLLSNADHASLRELYHGEGDIVTVDRSSVLAGQASARQRVSEILVVMN